VPASVVFGRCTEGHSLRRCQRGHRGVFARKGSKRLPIVELKGPSLPHVFVKHGAVGIERAQEQFVKELQHEVDFALHQIAASKGPRVNIGPGGATIG
jgi:hypothetical protein